MTGEPLPPTAGPPAVHATLSGLGDAVARLREILHEAEPEERSPGLLAERDEHALAIFQEILSLPPVGLPPGELFGLAMDRLSRLLAADRALLFVLDEATGRLVPRSGRGVRREEMESVSFDPREAVETMSAFIAATGAGDVPTGSVEYKTIFAVGATLFVMTLIVNAVSIRLVRKYREVYE